MKIEFYKEAEADFLKLDSQLKGFFSNHIDKLQGMPPRRHLRHGIPFHVENVTHQARMVYNERENTLYVIRCFATHKEYERWCRTYWTK